MEMEPKIIKILNGTKVIKISDRLDSSLLDNEMKNSDVYKYGYYLDDSGILYDIRVFNHILLTILQYGCRIHGIYKDNDITYLELKVPIKSFMSVSNDKGELEELSCDRLARFIKNSLNEYSIAKYNEDISKVLKIIFIITDYSWNLEKYEKILQSIEDSKKDPFIFTHHKAKEN